MFVESLAFLKRFHKWWTRLNWRWSPALTSNSHISDQNERKTVTSPLILGDLWWWKSCTAPEWTHDTSDLRKGFITVFMLKYLLKNAFFFSSSIWTPLKSCRIVGFSTLVLFFYSSKKSIQYKLSDFNTFHPPNSHHSFFNAKFNWYIFFCSLSYNLLLLFLGFLTVKGHTKKLNLTAVGCDLWLCVFEDYFWQRFPNEPLWANKIPWDFSSYFNNLTTHSRFTDDG